MIGVPVAVLSAVIFAVLIPVLKVPRKGWWPIAAALMLGAAGYAGQAHPDLPGAAKQLAEPDLARAAANLKLRQQLSDSEVQSNSWLTIADAMVRHGQYGDAAEMLRGAVADEPDNGEAWLALGNALVGHAEGAITPPAAYAFERAISAAPKAAGPPFFYGLALAQSGDLAKGRVQWATLLNRSPDDAPWRHDLIDRLAALDAYMAAHNGTTEAAMPTM